MRHAVIMAGGSGTRLWPLSRAERPKQLLDVVADGAGGAHSLLAEAFTRLQAVLPAEQIWVCTAARYGEQVRAALPELRRRPADPRAGRPGHRERGRAGRRAGRRRRPRRGARRGQRRPRHPPRRALRRRAARPPTRRSPCAPASLVTLGITPTAPATGFGYVQRGAATEVPGVAEAASFREKPDLATAEAYLASGEYLWNSGMFVWRARTVLDALADHLPETAEGLRRIVGRRAGRGRGTPCSPRSSRRCRRSASTTPSSSRRPREPGRVLVADLDVDWLDVGSWPALAHTLDVDDAGNAVRGLTVVLDGSGNIVLSDDPDHLVALVGVRDSVVVHTADVTMVCPVARRRAGQAAPRRGRGGVRHAVLLRSPRRV